MTHKPQFFDGLASLNSICAQHNGDPSALNEIGSLLVDSDIRREFFNNLNRKDWISTLLQNGYFESPPNATRTEKDEVRSPSWPESTYLARMATESPKEVAQVFAGIKTDNASVIYDMLQAALVMPPAIAATLVPVVSRAASESVLWFGFKEASDLCVRLAEGSESDAALKLADALFTPSTSKDEGHDNRRDEYWYIEGLEKVATALAKVKAHELLPRLCEWLKAAIEAKEYMDLKIRDDYSNSWRPAIEEHPGNHDFDSAGQLVGCVRVGFEQAVRSEQMSLTDSFEILAPYPYSVYRRLRIHLINEFAEENTDLACQTILEKALFEDYRCKHEYAMLVGGRLNLLSPEQQQEWFGWISEGPDMSDFDESIQRNLKREATEEDRQNRIRHWQFGKLHWVKNHLEGKWKDSYDEMLAEHDAPMFADMDTSPVRYGDESPMTVEELTALDFKSAVEKVSAWKSEQNDPWGSNRDGLAATFTHYVATSPEEFSKQATELIDRPAIFVRSYLGQMSEEVKAEHEIELPAVLELCQWVIEQPVEAERSPDEDGGMVDRDWQWTRDQISRFVENVCKAKTGDSSKYSPDNFRVDIWKLIENLCHDPADSNILHDVSQEDPLVHDYLDLGINSSRGKAVEAALEYARWVANHIKVVEGKTETIPDGFDSMPEVQKMLERQIEEGNQSVTAMSIIGSRMGLIHWIDKEWLAENAAKIFHLEGIELSPRSAEGWAAWNAFLVWVRPYVEFYNVFKSQFAYAVQQSATVELTDRGFHQPMLRLGEHLMILYGRGQLGLEEGGLLWKFLANSKPEIRRHAIGFVGRSLEGDKEVPADVVIRFQELWEDYWQGLGKQDAKDCHGALLFGTWFSSKKFPDDWALAQLEEFVKVDPTPEPDHSIVERLAEIGNVDVLKSVQILHQIVHGGQEVWQIYGWKDSSRSILEQAMNTPGEARQEAEQLIDYLGRRGYMELGELLN